MVRLSAARGANNLGGSPASDTTARPADLQRTRRSIVIAGAVLTLAMLSSFVRLFAGTQVLDLGVYLSGGHAVLHGLDLYGPGVGIRQYGFTYPPFAAALFALPSLLPLGLAILLMTIVSLISLATMVQLSAADLVRRLGAEGSTVALLTVVAMVASQPVRTTLWNGQVELLLAAMVMVDLLPMRGRRGQGVLVGIAAAIKLTPLIFIGYLLLVRRGRAAVVAGATFVVVSVGTWMALPGDSRHYWTRNLFNGAGIGDISRPSNQSILGVARRLLGPGPAGPVWAVLIVPTAVIGLGLAVRIHAEQRESMAVAVVGITGCLISPVSWSHHWVWFVPWVAGVAASAGRRTTIVRVATAVFMVYIVGINVVPQRAVEAWTPTRLVLENAYVLAVVAAFAVVVVRWRRSRLEPVFNGLARQPVAGDQRT